MGEVDLTDEKRLIEGFLVDLSSVFDNFTISRCVGFSNVGYI